MAPPRKRKMMRKGLLHASCWMVDKKGCFGLDLAVAALEKGGECLVAL